MEPGNPLLDEFVLSPARSPHPRVCFVPTASGDAEGYVAGFYRAFAPLDCRPVDLQLFARTVADLEAFVLEQDVIYVGGGNTASMLAVWRAHGLDRILRRAWEDRARGGGDIAAARHRVPGGADRGWRGRRAPAAGAVPRSLARPD